MPYSLQKTILKIAPAIFFYFIVYICFIGLTEVNETQKRETNQWHLNSFNDVPNGSIHALSPSISPEETLITPYEDLKSWIGFGCQPDSSHPKEWVYIGFNKTLNVINNYELIKLNNKYHRIIETQVTWDNITKTVFLIEGDSERSLFFQQSELEIENLLSHSQVSVKLDWFEQKIIYFTYPLGEQTRETIHKAREQCHSQ